MRPSARPETHLLGITISSAKRVPGFSPADSIWTPGFNLGFSFQCFTQAFCSKQTVINAVQALFLLSCEQGIVLDIEQVIHDEPYRFVGGHPVLFVEALEVDGNGKAPQRALTPQVAVDIEITQRKFA